MTWIVYVSAVQHVAGGPHAGHDESDQQTSLMKDHETDGETHGCI